MYDVIEMKSWIDEAASVAENRVRSVFMHAFSKLYSDKTKTKKIIENDISIKVYELVCNEDLDKVTNGPGFYIILSSYDIKDNPCKVSFGEFVALYRGECATVRKRVQSHLFNDNYQSEYNKRKETYEKKQQNSTKKFYEPFWPACLKLQPGVNGININKDTYNSYKWLVIVHEMKGSSQAVRKQAELAFDELFGKPAASREKIA